MFNKNLSLAMSLLLVAAVHATGCNTIEAASEDSMATADSALSAAQCMYFASNGTTRICHKTSSIVRPYVVLNVSEQACAQAHSGHLGDYVAYNDPNCLGLGCLPEGAPYDNTVQCCSGLTPINGKCGHADLCAGSTCANDSQCKLGCDSATGQCVIAPQGQSCGTNATCDAQGSCKPVDLCAGKNCPNDGGDCSSGCDPSTGQCVAQPPGSSCGRADVCSEQGTCVPADRCAGVVCPQLDSENNSCGSWCDPGTGQCVNTVGMGCGPGYFCTATLACCSQGDPNGECF